MKANKFLKIFGCLLLLQLSLSARAVYTVVHSFDLSTPTASSGISTTVPSYGSAYSEAVTTGSSSGYVEWTLSPAVDVQSGDVLRIVWGASANRPCKVSINGGSAQTVDQVSSSGERNQLRTVEYELTVSSVSSLKLQSSGGSGVSWFEVEIVRPGAYFFGYGPYNVADKSGYTNRKFQKVSDHEYQIADFVFDRSWTGAYGCYVGVYDGTNYHWVSSDLGENHSQSANLSLYDLPLALLQSDAGCTDSKKMGWLAGNVAKGAKGTLRIYDNYPDDNLFVGFVPDGYALLHGLPGAMTAIPFAPTADPGVYQTDEVTLTADMVGNSGYRYYVGVSTDVDGDYARTMNSLDETFRTMGSGNFVDHVWSEAVSGYTAGKHGYFQIWVNSCDGSNKKNFMCHFVPLCDDPMPTIAVTSGTSVDKCPGDEVTLTASGVTGTAQWYMDGVELPGATLLTYQTSLAGSYTVASINGTCVKTSDALVVSNQASSNRSVYDKIYVKQNRLMAPVRVFELPTASTAWTLTSTLPTGLALVQEGKYLVLKGKPTSIGLESLTSVTVSVEGDACGSVLVLHCLPETTKPTVAVIVDGKDKGDWTEKKAGEVLDAASAPLFGKTELTDAYDITFCNEYAKNGDLPKELYEYYSRYDVIVLTDYGTSTKKGMHGGSYVNAIGTLVDKIPLLNMEAFVVGQSNWAAIGLTTSPKTPSSEQYAMDLLCPAHEVFLGMPSHVLVVDEASYTAAPKETYHHALQGFSLTEAPEGMMLLATIPDGSGGTYITCCERITVVEARMLMMCINSKGSEFTTSNGALAIRHAIAYLLKKDVQDVADCALVFDNGGADAALSVDPNVGNHDWHVAANWREGEVPSAFHIVRIEQPCVVSAPGAHCASMMLSKGRTLDYAGDYSGVSNGSVTIRPTGGLSVADSIMNVYGEDFVHGSRISASDLVVQADADHSGALALASSHTTPATVWLYSKASYGTAATWQYVGVPFVTLSPAQDHFTSAWMCRWDEGQQAQEAGSSWTYVANQDVLHAFEGYALTQTAPKTYVLQGDLNPGVDHVYTAYRTGTGGADYSYGFNLLANSWAAPIDLQRLKTTDFDGLEATIYIYNTGSEAEWSAAGAVHGDGQAVAAGQYNAVPVGAISTWDLGRLTTIPPMQGFFVRVKEGETQGTLTVPYAEAVFNEVTQSTKPLRVQRQLREPLKITVTGSRFADELYVLPDAAYTMGYDDGYDGRKMQGDARVPQLMALTEDGEMSVAAVPTADSLLIAFQAGEDTQYTLTFSGADDYLLEDMEIHTLTPMTTGSSYAFAVLSTAQETRFRLVRAATAPGLVTGLEAVATEASVQEVYDAQGRLLYQGPSACREVLLPGVYVVRQGNRVVKIIR